jgi:O-antigen/teichoic acid export membrane protein
MLKMGFLISMSSFITIGSSYLIRIFITHQGNLVEVGLYNAGFAIISTYVGLIFSAMGADYFPRLSGMADNIISLNDTINKQIEIVLIILGPILVFFIMFIKWIIQILYSSQFTAVNSMIIWAAIGMLFKAVSWCIAYSFLAKGLSKLFFWNEIVANIYLIALNIFGYYNWGLTGLGYAFLLSYFIYMVQVLIITNKTFNFKLGKDSILILLIQLIFSCIGIFISLILKGSIYYFTSLILIISNLFYSFYLLNHRVGLNLLISKYIKHLR